MQWTPMVTERGQQRTSMVDVNTEQVEKFILEKLMSHKLRLLIPHK
jgi:hypothetical protein